MDDFTMLRVAVEDGVAVVTIDHPPVNAQNYAFQEEVKRCFDQLSDDKAVRAIVLTGAGRIFSAGADIKDKVGGVGSPGMLRENLRSARESYHSVVECVKPVVAAINGAALGSGLALAASCDILVASENAKLGLPEIDVGLMGGGRHAQRLFGHSLLRRMALTGYRVSGAELYRLGVVEACVPAEELMPTAVRIAREIASKSPLAAQLFKRTLNTVEQMSLRDGYRYEQDMTIQISVSDDALEAQQAFVEKRAPRFRGR